jgi:hypothetical protein
MRSAFFRPGIGPDAEDPRCIHERSELPTLRRGKKQAEVFRNRHGSGHTWYNTENGDIGCGEKNMEYTKRGIRAATPHSQMALCFNWGTNPPLKPRAIQRTP